MSDSHTVVKIVLVLGIVFLMVSFMSPTPVYVGQPAGPNPFTTFSNAISAGPSFPTFDNPFAPNALVVNTIPMGNDPFGFTDFVSVTGCANATYWNCVSFNDGDSSYVTLNKTHPILNVNMTDLTGGAVISVTMTIWCRSIGTAPNIDNFHLDGGVVRPVSNCPVSDTYHPVSFDISALPHPWDLVNFNAAVAGICLGSTNCTETPSSNGSVRITFIELKIYQEAGATTPCGGDFFTNTACQIGRFFDSFVKGILFVFNGISFVIATLIAILVYIGTIIVAVFTGIFGMFSNLFALFSGAPPIITGLVAVIIAALGTFLLLTLLKTARGSGAT